jgi:hypothetical protein
MYQNKYLKYKNKYLELKNQINISQTGGAAGGEPIINDDREGAYVQVAGETGRKLFLDVRRIQLSPNNFANGDYRLVKSNIFNKYKESYNGLASTIAEFEHMDEKLADRTSTYNPLEDPYIKDMLLVTCNNDPAVKAALLRLLRNMKE